MNATNIPERLKIILNINSPKWFVNNDNELIVEPKNNIYFLLNDIENELDLKCKIIAWLSRPAHKALSNYWQKRIGNILNGYLGTNFSKDEIELIYSYLGNDCNRQKTIRFINSNYDLSILDKRNNNEG